MKKILMGALLSGSLLSTQALAADTSFYVGLDYLKSSNTFTQEKAGISTDTDIDSDNFKLKIGYAWQSNWRLQLYYLNETYDKTLFDDSNDKLHEIGMDVIKAFEVTPEFFPFVQVGLGYGWMSIDGYSDSSIKEIGAKVGAGVIYKITPEFEVLGGIDYQYRNWDDITYGFITLVETAEESFNYYIGVNYHF